jgi:hypothetical protein
VVAEKSGSGSGGGAFRAAVDVGGTFTDVVALDPVSGELVIDKVETTPSEPSVGVLEALAKSGAPMGGCRVQVKAAGPLAPTG